MAKFQNQFHLDPILQFGLKAKLKNGLTNSKKNIEDTGNQLLRCPMSNSQFIQIFYNFFDKKLSHLSANAIAGYLHIRRRYNGKNNGNISFSCRELGKCLGKSKSTAKNIFDELVKNNLISISKNSVFDPDYMLERISRKWIINDLKKQKIVQHTAHLVQTRKPKSQKYRKHGAKND